MRVCTASRVCMLHCADARAMHGSEVLVQCSVLSWDTHFIKSVTLPMALQSYHDQMIGDDVQVHHFILSASSNLVVNTYALFRSKYTHFALIDSINFGLFFEWLRNENLSKYLCMHLFGIILGKCECLNLPSTWSAFYMSKTSWFQIWPISYSTAFIWLGWNSIMSLIQDLSLRCNDGNWQNLIVGVHFDVDFSNNQKWMNIFCDIEMTLK